MTTHVISRAEEKLNRLMIDGIEPRVMILGKQELADMKAHFADGYVQYENRDSRIKAFAYGGYAVDIYESDKESCLEIYGERVA